MLRAAVFFAMLTASASVFAQSSSSESLFASPRAVLATGDAPVFYRLSPTLVLPWIRTAAGAQFRVAPAPGAAAVAFSLDALAGALVRFGRGSRVGAFAEGGYGYVGFEQHLAVLGGGLVYGLARDDDDRNTRFARPRAVLSLHWIAGVESARPAQGFRVAAAFGVAAYTLTLGYQQLSTDTAVGHELRVLLGSSAAIGEAR